MSEEGKEKKGELAHGCDLAEWMPRACLSYREAGSGIPWENAREHALKPREVLNAVISVMRLQQNLGGEVLQKNGTEGCRR